MKLKNKNAKADSLLGTITVVSDSAEGASAGYDVCLGIDINYVCGKPVSDPARVPHMVDEKGDFISSGKMAISSMPRKRGNKKRKNSTIITSQIQSIIHLQIFLKILLLVRVRYGLFSTNPFRSETPLDLHVFFHRVLLIWGFGSDSPEHPSHIPKSPSLLCQHQPDYDYGHI